MFDKYELKNEAGRVAEAEGFCEIRRASPDGNMFCFLYKKTKSKGDKKEKNNFLLLNLKFEPTF
ncbi:MAG: hypothetical protein QME68_02085 [Elusimicrobiota bacterium]|nr:hypothetical protein [Elusimicrobiota bacterium]